MKFTFVALVALVALVANTAFAQAAASAAPAASASASKAAVPTVVCNCNYSCNTPNPKAAAPAPKSKSKAAMHKPQVDQLATVRRLAEENAALRNGLINSNPVSTSGVVPDVFAPAPNYAVDGKVYSDKLGNTFERHEAGGRLCRFFINGQLRKEQFVRGHDSVATKRECDVLAEEFQASVTPTTASQSSAVVTAAVEISSATGCAAGLVQGVLNLPGNAKHGQKVCARPGDPNISQWL